ncbi:NAD(P)-binding protein [Conidiobolus coronatus NRRL 28638]|uniref:Methylenetetrahydrofolate dehydrogenase [NAD(+)] n=1 Tax=Conidiobolus coronatus (strain ATCC 28846 / CBS 209.66 / NRRL 28638) TaxID=796925 RepID=A0A137PDI0_CONC2|nr:NAD(P)-binding protein [Conidiobolus coronatus NRRL 28638]|eukprot:KXN72991.1 NAD(P)-binding protein [Conidiobolus coronatus NRRL 28638]
MPGHQVNSSTIAVKYRDEIKNTINSKNIRPKLVSFLANEDPAAQMYANWTAKTCAESGIEFECRKVDKKDLEDKIVEANEDNNIHGIMVYYPVYGDRQDQYLQSVVSEKKDVEGLCHKYVYNMYHNVRFLDDENTKKCIIPCTPLAVVKILEAVGVYNTVLPYGNRLHGKTIAVINRSEVVGRPLAALLANDGARVFSVDINDILEFNRGAGLKMSKHQVSETDYKLEDILPKCDVVITGVPTPNYQVNTELLKEGVVAINFSSHKNFAPDIKERASIYVPSIGKVTIAMLERNLLRLYDYYNKQ